MKLHVSCQTVHQTNLTCMRVACNAWYDNPNTDMQRYMVALVRIRLTSGSMFRICGTPHTLLEQLAPKPRTTPRRTTDTETPTRPTHDCWARNQPEPDPEHTDVRRAATRLRADRLTPRENAPFLEIYGRTRVSIKRGARYQPGYHINMVCWIRLVPKFSRPTRASNRLIQLVLKGAERWMLGCWHVPNPKP